MRIRDDDITAHNSSCSAASTKRKRERSNVSEKEEKTLTHRGKETGIFSMMGFDSATSSFLAL